MPQINKQKKRGCTGFPEGNWHDCCVQHDLDYEAGGSFWDKVRADWKLMKCVAAKDPLVLRIIDPFVELFGRGVKWLLGVAMFLAVMTLGLKAWYQHRYYQWRANK